MRMQNLQLYVQYEQFTETCMSMRMQNLRYIYMYMYEYKYAESTVICMNNLLKPVRI